MTPAKNQAPESPPSSTAALLNIIINIVLPTIILSKLSKNTSLGPTKALILAAAIPVAYGIYEIWKTKKVNTMSIIGLVSVVLSGGLTLIGKGWFWIACKEAIFPILLGAFVLISHKMKEPFVKLMFLNPQMINMDQVNKHLNNESTHKSFNKILWNSSLFIAGSFVISSVLNYFLAFKLLYGKEPDTEAYTAALGKMNWMGFVAIGLPLMIMMMLIGFRYLYPQLSKLFGVEMADLTNQGQTVRRKAGDI